MAGQAKQAAKGSTPQRRRESEAERADRNMGELLQELRVALPGVQVLFAFLLAVPFTPVFGTVSSFERDVYFGTLCGAALASALLIAPSAVHRLNFRAGDKAQIVFVSNKLAIAGLAVLALTITGVMLLISHVIFSPAAAVVATSLSGAVFLLLWAVLPLWERRASHRDFWSKSS